MTKVVGAMYYELPNRDNFNWCVVFLQRPTGYIGAYFDNELEARVFLANEPTGRLLHRKPNLFWREVEE